MVVKVWLCSIRLFCLHCFSLRQAEFTEGDETPEQIAEKRRLQLEEADAKKKADEDANQAEMDRLAASTANQAASGTASADGEDDE